jgi:hypothetical protein
VCLLSLVVFFREFLDSGFNLIAGDVGDNRFVIAILEHWRAVAHGQVAFNSPNFFWPEHGVLGFSESLFLLTLPYAIGRSAGMDPYIAFELTLILLKAVGFFSMLWLLRSFVEISRSVAVVGAVLFTLANLYFIWGGHAHLMTVAFVPLLTALFCASWRTYGRGGTRLGCLYAASFGLLLALVLFTSFYLGWFAILAGGAVIVSALLATILRGRGISPLREWIRNLSERGPIFAVAVSTFTFAIIPFVITYMPALKRTGGRSFQENLLYSARPSDVINTGRGNWMWGRFLDTVMVRVNHGPMVFAENQVGWPPITLVLLAAGAVLGFRGQGIRGRTGSAKCNRRFLAAVLSASFIVCWVLSLDIGGRSLWWLIFRFVPGGTAIRVPARLNLVLNVFVVIIVCLVLEEFKERQVRAWTAAFWVMSLLLIAEQINTVPTHTIRRHGENASLTRVNRPPSICASFFLAHPASRERPFYADQIDAMLIARMKNLPTLNGYSGWLPNGWDFLTFNKDYLQNVKKWALDKRITAGLCALDLRDGSWALMGTATGTPYSLGSEIDFHKGGDAGLYEGEGWGEEEEGGSWTVGGYSVLSLNLPAPPTTDFFLLFRAHAFTPLQRPSFGETLRVNNSELANWSITYGQTVIEKRVRLPKTLFRSPLVRIEFFNHDPRSPAEFGLSTDDRKLGLALESMKLEAAR